MTSDRMTRRTLLRTAGAASLALSNLAAVSAQDETVDSGELGEPHRRKIPSTGEELAIMGIGTWQTFNAGDQAEGHFQRAIRRISRSISITLELRPVVSPIGDIAAMKCTESGKRQC